MTPPGIETDSAMVTMTTTDGKQSNCLPSCQLNKDSNPIYSSSMDDVFVGLVDCAMR